MADSLLRNGPVPRFDPFPGLRYSPTHVGSLDDVVCPPYDVISDAERSTLVARSPSNVVRLELPADDGTAPELDRYQAAAVLLDAWRDGGVLRRDPVPAFYGYRMTFSDPAGEVRRTVGVIGALALEPPGAGILPHEETTPKAKSDRLRLLEATRTNLSPIWALTPTTGLAALCDPPRHPAEHTTDLDHVRHECWPITEPERIAAIRDLVASAPVLIADGHHRFETALAYQSAQDRRSSQGGGGADAIMALVVELADEQLSVQAIHRLIDGLPAGFDLPGALSEWFDLMPTAPGDRTIGARMEAAGALAVVTARATWLARPLPPLTASATHDLDSSRLDAALREFPPHELRYQHGWDRCVAAVRSGDADAAVLLRPANVDQIAAISRGGVRMPPKTTFFWPKPRTGLVMRELVG